jgi:hypothetical protein
MLQESSAIYQTSIVMAMCRACAYIYFRLPQTTRTLSAEEKRAKLLEIFHKMVGVLREALLYQIDAQ